jgi:hypothetical protein
VHPEVPGIENPEAVCFDQQGVGIEGGVIYEEWRDQEIAESESLVMPVIFETRGRHSEVGKRKGGIQKARRLLANENRYSIRDSAK